MTVAVRFDQVGKRFRISETKSLKDLLLGVAGHRRSPVEVQAVRDLTFDIAVGESVALLGHNGSGKSTSLKMLAGTVAPTTGRIWARGRIAPLLELGAGFHPDLTGRENIYLNASILGIKREQTLRRFDEIVDFAEVGEFLDTPVKFYSSGMGVRLGFAIAVTVDPDVLLVDEVLAVGDEAFARKCLAKIAEFQAAGKTILFVTHSLDLVTELCTRGIVVDRGRVQYDGDPAFAVGTLRKILGTDRPVGEPEQPVESGGVVVHAATPAATPGGPKQLRFAAGEPLHLRVECEVLPSDEVYPGEVGVVVMGAGDIPVWSMRTPKGQGLPAVPGRYCVEFAVDGVPRLNGAFIVGVQVDHAETGLPITARRFDDAVWVETGDLPGLLDVPAEVKVVPA